MVAFLLSIPSRVKAWLAIAGLVIVALGYAFREFFEAGERSEADKHRRENAEAAAKAREVEADVDALSDDNVDRRLDRWVRKPKR